MKRPTITTLLTLAVMIGICCPARTADFWQTYGQKLTYNYSIKTGTIPAMSQAGLRLSNAEMTSIITKTFSQALSQRFKQVSKQRSASAIVCIFTPEPERCFTENILTATFDEVQIVNAPSFSNKFLKKLKKYYGYTLNGGDNELERYRRAAGKVPARKKFNPRFGFNLNEPEIMVSSPFYSYVGIYVEPRYGTRTGPSLSLISGKFFFDVRKSDLTIKYHIGRGKSARGYTSISVNRRGEVLISNDLILK